ncbi:sugar phosphate isomerase/epimerase [soil metagenome]
MNRRQFIQTGAIAVAGTAIALPGLSMPASNYKVGLQLYTLRDIIGKDPKGVLKMVADLGYKELETYGYNDGMLFGLTSKDFNDYVKSLGMQVMSGHYQLGKSERSKAMKGTLLNDWERAVSDAKQAGQGYMVVPYLGADERPTIDSYKEICDIMNKSADVCKKYGIRLNYHNHDFEFAKLEGQIPYDVMLERLDPKQVGMEMDLYWVVYAGFSPLDYFKKYPGRFEQWHVKDMDKTDRKKNADIGTGTIDFKTIFTKAKESGLKHWYMEEESYPISSTESVKASIGYLKTL